MYPVSVVYIFDGHGGRKNRKNVRSRVLVVTIHRQDKFYPEKHGRNKNIRFEVAGFSCRNLR